MTAKRTDRHDASTESPSRQSDRMVFVDVLRVALIILVIAHHAAQPYGPTGGDWPVDDPANTDWLSPFFTVNAAFFMGLLFLLAGYFVPRSLERKGTGRFTKDRWKRIGVPLVFFALFVHLPVAFMLESPRPPFTDFLRSSYENGWQEVYIHLWFLGHLLLYSGVYVAWRLVADRLQSRPRRAWPLPNHAAILAFVIGLALATWVVRGWYPIDEWIPLFFVLATEPAHLPQYVSLFAIGVLAYRGGWLRRWSTTTGMIWLTVGVTASIGFYVLRLSSPETFSDWIATGGFNWESMVLSSWEAFICAGMSIGLIVLFREVFNRTNRVLAAMAVAGLAAYVLHLLVVVGLQSAIEGFELPALVKFAAVTLFGVILAFGAAHLSRLVPGWRILLGFTAEPAASAGRQVVDTVGEGN
jgi:fucose 4-O-acetylase-like acetyltransferase